MLRHPTIRRVTTDHHAEIERTPALARAIRPFPQARRARIDALIDRAIARSELASSVDREMAADLIAAPMYWRFAVLGRRSDREHVERLARMTDKPTMTASLLGPDATRRKSALR